MIGESILTVDGAFWKQGNLLTDEGWRVDADEIPLAVGRALNWQNQSAVLGRQQSSHKSWGIIGESNQIQQVFDIVEKVADSDSTVLIVGETGTGKELVVKAIHRHSRRCGKPMVAVNCGAIPEELLESELFGHEKGAFTNAVRTRMGRFELANGGTIFLDEVGDMSPKLQVKILRVLQERKFERVGGVKSIKTDVRVVAATNQDLERKVALGEFREDLFYRLNVIPIQVPPLRMRRSDIPLLINHFLRWFNETKGKDIKEITPEARDMLGRYRWPGNVRELENLMERLVILVGKGRITVQDLPDKIQFMPTDLFKATLPLPQGERPFKMEVPDEGLSFDLMMNEFGKRLILEALNKTGWVKKKAAQLLGLNRTTLIEKMKRMNLDGIQTKVKTMTSSTYI